MFELSASNFKHVYIFVSQLAVRCWNSDFQFLPLFTFLSVSKYANRSKVLIGRGWEAEAGVSPVTSLCPLSPAAPQLNCEMHSLKVVLEVDEPFKNYDELMFPTLTFRGRDSQ